MFASQSVKGLQQTKKTQKTGFACVYVEADCESSPVCLNTSSQSGPAKHWGRKPEELVREPEWCLFSHISCHRTRPPSANTMSSTSCWLKFTLNSKWLNKIDPKQTFLSAWSSCLSLVYANFLASVSHDLVSMLLSGEVFPLYLWHSDLLF